MTQRVFGPDRLASRAFVESAKEAADGVVAAASYDATSRAPQYERFLGEFRDRFGYEPEAFAAHAYDGMRILIEAIEEAGPNRTRIRDALYRRARYVGVTGEIEFDTTLNDVGTVYLATVQGKAIAYRAVDFAAGVGSLDPYRRMDGTSLGAAVPETDPEPVGAPLRVGCFLPLDETGLAAVGGMERALDRHRRGYPEFQPVELIVCDARGAWGSEADQLAEMVTSRGVVAVLGSTERRGSHLLETMAAKLHFPILPLCGADPTLTAIPLPWVFCPAARGESTQHQPAELGEDAMAIVLEQFEAGARTRSELRAALSGMGWFAGRTGEFRFDSLGNRIERSQAPSGAGGRAP